VIEQSTSDAQRQRHNGALALTALVAARGHLDARLDVECSDPEELVSIRLADIAAGLQQVSPVGSFLLGVAACISTSMVRQAGCGVQRTQAVSAWQAVQLDCSKLCCFLNVHIRGCPGGT